MPSAIYEIQIKQRGGKWAPQCQRHAAEALESWQRMQRMKRKLRMMLIEGDGTKTIVAKYEPPRKPT